MSTHTAAASSNSVPSLAVTLGARLAEASRRAQGFTTAIDDPAVLAELRGLCAVPRPTIPLVVEKQEGPAP